MAYVGTPLDTTNAFQSLAGKRFNGDGSTTAFTLDSAPNSTLDIEVFVGNVRQDPNSAYTISGTTLTFTGAPPSGTNNIYVVHQAKSVGTIDVPSAGVQSGSLSSAFLTGQTDIGGAIADADLFLVDDGAGGTFRKTAASRLKTYIGSGLPEADQWRVTADFNGGANPITSNWERNDQTFDKIGTGWSESSGTFTAPSTGIYYIEFTVTVNHNADERYIEAILQGSADGFTNTLTLASSYGSIAIDESSATYDHITAKAIYDITNTSNNQIRCRLDREHSGGTTNGHTDKNMTYVTMLKLGDT